MSKTIDQEIEQLEKLLAQKKAARGLAPLLHPAVGDSATSFAIDIWPSGLFKCTAYTNEVETTRGANWNVFQTPELAKSYGDAFNTMLQLRHQAGTVNPFDVDSHWWINLLDESYELHVAPAPKSLRTGTIREICPAFRSKEAALAAIAAVGAERIITMFKVFHHVHS